MIDKPLFSIIIPVYNRAHIILKTLQSVHEQSFKNYELIVVDDGSNDNLKNVFDDYVTLNKITNWNYYHKINGERGAARNYGVQKSSGSFVTFLDSDDVLYKMHLDVASKYLNKNHEISIFHSAYEFNNPALNLTRKVNYPKTNILNNSILKGNIMSCFGVFLKREVALNYTFCEDRKLSGSEDWLLWLEILPNYSIFFQSEITGCMIEHDERSVLNFNSEQLQNRADLLFEKLKNNQSFIAKYGLDKVNEIYAHMLSYGALHLMLSGMRKEAISMLISAVKVNPLELLKKRTLGILKNVYRIK